MSFHFLSLKTSVSGDFAHRDLSRSVFERSEIRTLELQFSFLNKKVGEEAWRFPFDLQLEDCLGNSLGKISSFVEVPEIEAIIQYKQVWEGERLFSAGKYTWILYSEGEEIRRSDFWINDIAPVSAVENPYFEVNSLQLYAADNLDGKVGNKRFLKQISRHSTPYPALQCRITNKTALPWRYELFFHLTDHKGERKASFVRQGEVQAHKKFYAFNFEVIWENDALNSSSSEYYWEIEFMNQCVASALMPVGEHALEGTLAWQAARVLLPPSPKDKDAEVEIQVPLEELLAKMDSLTGLDTVKGQIYKHLDYTRFVQIRQSKGLEKNTKIQLHSVFTGNPGTGKTTVIKLLGKIYQGMGLLSKGHLHKVDRADLIGEYIGHTAPKVKKAIEEARGGILFVDEAYALLRDEADVRDFGREAVEILMMEMSDGEGDIAIMFAGYPKEMEKLLRVNPGLKSRFQHYYHFEDYSVEALLQIAKNHALGQDLVLAADGLEKLKEKIQQAHDSKDATFGNARFAKQLIDHAKVEMSARIMKSKSPDKLSLKKLSTLLGEDFDLTRL